MYRKCLVSLFFMSTLLVPIGIGTAGPAQLVNPGNRDASKKESAMARFIRLKPGEQADCLQTAIVKYRSRTGSGLEVDLVSVVHLGEAAYYRQIDKKLGQYDVVLYEFVAPKKGILPKKGEAGDPFLSWFMDFEIQTDHIDYTRANFVHADLDATEVRALFQKRKPQSPSFSWEKTAEFTFELLYRKFQGPERARRYLLQAIVADPTTAAAQAVYLHERNNVALKVLAQETAKGHKKVAIFYGAMHMPDFDRHLVEDFALEPVQTQWLTAWQLKNKANQKVPGFETLLEKIDIDKPLDLKTLREVLKKLDPQSTETVFEHQGNHRVFRDVRFTANFRTRDDSRPLPMVVEFYDNRLLWITVAVSGPIHLDKLSKELLVELIENQPEASSTSFRMRKTPQGHVLEMAYCLGHPCDLGHFRYALRTLANDIECSRKLLSSVK